MLEHLESFREIIRAYRIVDYEQEGNSYRMKKLNENILFTGPTGKGTSFAAGTIHPIGRTFAPSRIINTWEAAYWSREKPPWKRCFSISPRN